MIESLGIKPKNVLEIGCCHGFWLQKLKEAFDCECYGIDPSAAAIEDGSKSFPEINLSVGTAETLDFADDSFDLIIFGFCLYLCDRKDLFKIALEADRCLADNGNICITDFCPPFAYKNEYAHCEGLHSYKMNYGKMFTWNPAYTEVASQMHNSGSYDFKGTPDNKVATIVLHKNTAFAYAVGPF
jgi:ubiquinone/menaquinone biosynthesis C-methylase UbiE